MKLGITSLIHSKDDIKFVTEFPGLLGHPVYRVVNNNTWFAFLTFPNYKVKNKVSYILGGEAAGENEYPFLAYIQCNYFIYK